MADATTIHMLTLQVRICAENLSVAVSQWAAETMGFGRRRVTWQHNGKIIEWGSWSGRIPSRRASATSKVPAPSTGISNLIIALHHSVIWHLNGRFVYDTWQIRLWWRIRNWRQHWMSSLRLAFADDILGLTKPQLGCGRSCTLVCISSPQCMCCSSWWCLDTEDNKEETSGHRNTPIRVFRDFMTYFLLKPLSFTISSVYLDIAGKGVGENNTQLFALNWPGDEESILRIVTTIVDMTILSIGNSTITSLPVHCQKIRDGRGFWEESNGDGGQHTWNNTPTININTAAGWAKAGWELNNTELFSVVHLGQQAHSTSDAQRPTHSACSYLPLDDILPPPAEDMIYEIWEELDDHAETWRLTSRRFRRT